MVPPSTVELAGTLEIGPDDVCLDLCCGSGYLALEAARRGAREVWATDIDPACVAATRRAAEERGLTVHTACGDLFDPVRGRRFSVIVANLPQTPFPDGVDHPKSGGPRGLRYFERVAREARTFLVPRGRLYMMSLSLVPKREFLALFEPEFRVVQIGESRRPCSREEYDRIHPGLWAYLQGFEMYDGYFLNRYFIAHPAA